MINQLKERIESYFDTTTEINKIEANSDIDRIIELLNSGKIRVCEKINNNWIVNTWIKKAILLAFKLKSPRKQDFDSYDKLGLLKYNYETPSYRKVPMALIREGVYIANDAVIMPSYINIGAYIGEKTMIDINAVIGSCAQIGKNCHISALSCIGGVLEPLVANPVIIEDNCFIGVHSSILEGAIVQEGAVVASGVTISASTKIINRKTGDITYGIIPSGSVVVSGSYPSNGVNISCAVIVKHVDAKTRSKSSINELLRD
ncbi:MAG: 2,3,4,5-tetrahydropyridine-2,6-dicarboxylate N-succinyltransferase [Alphaproteobacteria bacterium]|nr:2,3,4,5-tetrahydropyridine-2,6-dicarboxylate N-succinyltransferase [Alphaproteobacteria bacterium]